LTRAAINEPIKELQKATHFKIIRTLEDGKHVYQATCSNNPQALPMVLSEIPHSHLQLRSICMVKRGFIWKFYFFRRISNLPSWM